MDVIKGLNNGCIESGCSLIGGETAQMPGMYAQGEYDIAGFCVGVAERANIIDGSGIGLNDVAIGIASSGLHSNGFSLVRKVFSQGELKRLSAELLKPTRIYVKPVLALLKTPKFRNSISGIAHITGGAFYDKIARILPPKVNVRLRRGSWDVPKIFKLIQNKGNVEEKEMYHTLNMGIGMVLIARREAAGGILSFLNEHKLKAWLVGETISGKGEVIIS
jgi:phosphoribosylformylglycinamidine cyclo-ligase